MTSHVWKLNHEPEVSKQTWRPPCSTNVCKTSFSVKMRVVWEIYRKVCLWYFAWMVIWNMPLCLSETTLGVRVNRSRSRLFNTRPASECHAHSAFCNHNWLTHWIWKGNKRLWECRYRVLLGVKKKSGVNHLYSRMVLRVRKFVGGHACVLGLGQKLFDINRCVSLSFLFLNS